MAVETRFLAVCPVDELCAWVSKTQANVHTHIVEKHPDILNSPEEQNVTGQAYRKTLWATYRPVTHGR